MSRVMRVSFGLLTQADDHGRHLDNAALITGLLRPLRAEHTSVHVEDDLQRLANAGLICRYTGYGGRRYLHIAIRAWAITERPVYGGSWPGSRWGGLRSVG